MTNSLFRGTRRWSLWRSGSDCVVEPTFRTTAVFPVIHQPSVSQLRGIFITLETLWIDVWHGLLGEIKQASNLWPYLFCGLISFCLSWSLKPPEFRIDILGLLVLIDWLWSHFYQGFQTQVTRGTLVRWRSPLEASQTALKNTNLVIMGLSRILSLHFRSFTTRGHSLTTLTLALHELLHTVTKYNSHHPLALMSHSWLHWSRSHLRTLTQSLSPNHTRFISLGLPLALCRVLYCVYRSHSDSYLTKPSQ